MNEAHTAAAATAGVNEAHIASETAPHPSPAGRTVQTLGLSRKSRELTRKACSASRGSTAVPLTVTCDVAPWPTAVKSSCGEGGGHVEEAQARRGRIHPPSPRTVTVCSAELCTRAIEKDTGMSAPYTNVGVLLFRPRAGVMKLVVRSRLARLKTEEMLPTGLKTPPPDEQRARMT